MKQINLEMGFCRNDKKKGFFSSVALHTSSLGEKRSALF
jgi:hypothetical protein